MANRTGRLKGTSPMLSNPSEVIVMTEDRPSVLLHSLSVHHRIFPEIRAEGQSPEDAAVRLAELLESTLDIAPIDWRRKDCLVLDDVRAFSHLVHT